MSENQDSQEPSVWQGFKAFLMRGNVVDLAVAVVVGAAFTNIVNSVVKGVISPVIAAFGTKDLDKYSSCLKGPCKYDVSTGTVESGVPIMWGTVLNAALSFLITAAVVYFLMVLPMAKYLARQAARKAALKGSDEETVELTELEVLKQIRDSLVARRTVPEQSSAGGDPAAGRASAGADPAAGKDHTSGA